MYPNRTLNRLNQQPVATYGLIIACILMFLVETFTGGSQNTMVLYNLGAMYPAGVQAGEYWRLFTAMFLHIGWMHIFMNMLMLYFIGQQIEMIFGHWRFLTIYLLSGLAGNVASFTAATTFGNENIISAGASTALFGTLGAFLMLGDVFRSNPFVREQARQFFILIIINLVFDLMAPHIDIFGHIGGVLGGFLVAMAVGAPKVGMVPKNRRILGGSIFVIALGLFIFIGATR